MQTKTTLKTDFTYLIEKILNSDFTQKPFKHIYIEDFFSQTQLNDILNSTEISAPIASNDKELIDGLISKGFKPISFPGCTTDINKYIKWHKGNRDTSVHSATEGFGLVFRLYRVQSKILNDLNEFLASDAFNKAIAEKFEIDFSDCIVDGGIQKYLDGYEISPHPDTRKKAATFMVNINPSFESEKMNHHTHYLKLKDNYSYVEKFWNGNKDIDRGWVPWFWAETIKQQKKNNSIVLFSPSDDTLHGVKTNYDHLSTQRTQLYGNLWYKTSTTKHQLEWEDLDLVNHKNTEVSLRKSKLKQKIKSILPESVINIFKENRGKETGKRNV